MTDGPPVDREPPLRDRPYEPAVRHLYGLFIRHRRETATIIAVALLMGLLLTALITPRYTASASIQIDQQVPRVLQSQEADPVAAYQDADRFLKTQADILHSRRMAMRVASALHFLSDDAFLRRMHSAVPEPSLGDAHGRRRDATLRAIERGLDVYLPNDSRIVQISFASPDPELSALIANTYATSFIRYNLQRRYDSSAYARDFLGRQLADAKQRLEQSERQSNAYARGIGLIRTTEMNDARAARPLVSVVTASLSQLNTALNDAHASRIAAEAKWRRVERASPLGVAEVVGNQAVQTLIGQRAAAQSALDAELAKRQEGYPTVGPLRAQVRNLDDQVTRLAADIRATIGDDYRIAQQRESALEAQVAELKGATLGEQDRSVELNILTREVDTNRALYDALLQRFKELSAEAGVTTSNIALIDEATRPFTPSSPRLAVNLALALLAGLAIAAATIFVREQLDDRLQLPADTVAIER